MVELDYPSEIKVKYPYIPIRVANRHLKWGEGGGERFGLGRCDHVCGRFSLEAD